MPNRGNKRASQAKSQGETNCNNKASSSSGSNTAPPQSAPLTRAALVDLALQRQKKRTDHAAQKKAKSETLKNAGNNLFQGGDYQAAAEAYQEAIDEYGATAVLYSNLAAAYLKLEQYDDAEDAATEALELDPKIIKARYRRGLARKESGQYRAALIDFKAVLEQDSTRTEARHQMTETQFFYDKYGDEFSEVVDTEGLGYGWPYYDDEPMHVSDTESDSSDCGHLGNGVPCRFYNHGGCSRKDNCRYSHAPDNLSERDKLGRNVCLYSLFDSCKFGEAKCVYSHDKTFLPHGWWSHPEYVTLIKEKLDTRETEEQSKYFIVDVLKTLTRPREAAATASLPNVQTSSSRIPFVLVLALDGDLVEAYKLPTIAALQTEISVKKALNTNEAITHLASPDLKAVFVADAALAKHSNAQVLKKIVDFTRDGGSVVMGGSFSSFIRPSDLAHFFLTSWGLNWRSGSYHRATLKLNKSHNLAKSNSSLLESYSMKALHVRGVTPSAVVYKEDGANPTESPAVQVPFGKGHVGYIGDVNWENGSITVLHAMLQTSAASRHSAAAAAPPPTMSSMSKTKSSSSSRATSANPASPSDWSATSDQDEDGNNNIETPSEVKFVLILAFDSDITDEYKEPMINLIKLKSQVKVASTQSEALRLLYSDAITGVFVADAAIANRKNAQMLTKLVEYAKAGGSVVIGGAFSSLVKPKDIGAFFLKSWGVPWKPGSYHRTTFFLNPAHELAKSNPVLAQSYSMKALHLKDISPDVVVYRPTRESRLESLVFPPGPVTNMNESPVVRTRVGKGYLGYIGDVNWEDDSANLVLAMMGLLGPRQSQSQPQAGPSGSAAKVAPSTAKPAPSQPSPVSQAACVPKASTPAPTSTSSSNQKPFTSISKESFLLLLSLEEDDFFATSNAHCLSAIREKVVVSQALTLSTALTKLDDKHLAGVFVTDTGIVKPENKEILPRLLRYVKQGGVVIVGGSFSSFVSASDMDSFFSDTWGLSWKSGAYHRTRFLRNGRHDLVTNNPSLSSSYSMKALHLGGLALSDPIYLPADNLQLQTPLPFNDHTESPVVRRKIGDGYFGYVGDVDAEVETTNVVLAMFGLLDELTAQPASAVEEVKKAPELPPPSKQVNEATSKQVPLKQTTQNPVTPAVEVKTNIEVLPEPPREQAPPPSISATVNEAESEFRRLPVGPTRRPFLMILSFGNEKFFAGVQGDLLELLQSKLEVLHGLSHERVLELLSSQDLVGILITDAAIVDAENAYLLSRLVAFAKAGGIVVMGGSFSSHVKFNQLGTFFQDSWGVPWRSGDYTSCEIAVNTEHELAKSPVLPSAFMMKGLFVSGVTSQTALYVLAEGYATAKTSQAPVASAQVGKGRVGYIGDVGLQDEHSKIVLAMFGLSQ
ncbi:RNA polymerase II-associated protein 3 [Termitomyces sp. T112]|nr:RNA polymerase II-associated protein 3 [Termitomyces sp. T112]KAH0584618.1 hypothetical protein H2248_010151 [Termitomyces sp. 'cryptogamus']